MNGLATCVLAAACVSACADSETRRLRQTTRATYDTRTGRLSELTYDANTNGRIDTWTQMDGSRPVRSRIDRDEDGTLDRWEYYDADGRVLKVGMSRKGDGQPDAWAFAGPDGRVERMELSSTADEGKIDRWERYGRSTSAAEATSPLLAAEEDGNGDGRPDKWETYSGGALETVAFDENHDGRPDRRLTYRGGGLALIESEPDAAGRFRRQQPAR